MNRKQQSVVLASLLALALAGCSSTKTGSADDKSAAVTTSDTSSTSPAAPAPAAGAAATAATETPMAMPAQEPAAQPPAAIPGAQPNAMVVSIETVPRKWAAGSSAVGGSTTGATGSSMGEDKQYRITVRTDDGATRVVTQDKAPTYRSGDRVNFADGVINR